MGAFVDPVDLDAFVADLDPAKADAMIADAEAMALTVAPCLSPTPPAELTAGQRATARAIIRGAVIRWHEAGSGAYTQQSAGPYAVGIDTRQPRRGMFLTSEETALRAICGSAGGGRAFTVDMTPAGTAHLPWCSLMLGALYCSCGADIAGRPIYELGDLGG